MMGINHYITVIFAAVLISSYAGIHSCASINDTNILLRDVLEGYNKNVRPVKNQNDAINVQVSFYVLSIHELDEIRGIFSVMGILQLAWHDASVVWDPKMYGGVEYVLISYDEVWVPELILVNTAEVMDTLGKKWQRVFYHHKGYASWWPGDLLKSTCALDMFSYPFDTQECALSFNAWGYMPGQMKISPGDDRVDLRYYTESSTWKIVKSELRTSKARTDIDFHVYLQRRSGYVIVNVILPLTFLNFLNAFVFLLLPESGERISYCITVLLSIAVFMTIVSDTLPKSSEPVPVISYKLMFDMVISSLMTLVTILNLRICNREDTENVPYWLKSIYLFLACKWHKSQIDPSADNAIDTKNDNKMRNGAGYGKSCLNQEGLKRRHSGTNINILNHRKSIISVLDVEEIPGESIDKRIAKLISEVGDTHVSGILVTWKNISNMVDGIAFIVFTLLSVCSFVVFMVVTFQY